MAVNSAIEFRERLHLALDRISPSPAPVAAVRKRAKTMRAARRALATAGIAAGAAAVVAAVVILPGTRTPADREAQPAATLGGGQVVVGQGIVGGRPWRVIVDTAGRQICAGVAGLRPTCVGLGEHAHLTSIASLSGAEVAVPGHFGSSLPIWNSLFGTVRSDVTRLDLTMAGGRIIRLRPVAAAGHRWVGLVFPMGTDIARATAYAGQAELGYSVPFIGGDLRLGTYFLTWLPRGQPGPARADRYIASGGSPGHSWNALVTAGPWGYCVALMVPITGADRQNCWAAGSLRSDARVIMHWGAAPVIPRWIVGTAKPAVAYLRLTLAGGRTARVAVTDVSGQKFYAIEITPGPRIVRWGAFDAAGHRLYGGRGAPDAATAP